jgi:hypothetical protein
MGQGCHRLATDDTDTPQIGQMIPTTTRLRRHWIRTSSVAAFGVVLAAGIVAWYKADELIEVRLRPATARLLGERFGGDVDIQSMDVRVFPTLAIRVEGVSLRHQGRTDVPPLLTIGSMTMETSVWRLRRSHIDRVHIDGLEIVIPPQRRAAIPSFDGGQSDDGTSSSDNGLPDAFVGEIISENAKLTIMPRRANKSPRVFEIYRVKLASVQFSKPMPFEATLTNPKPAGYIETAGTLGPWHDDEPGLTPLDGTFTFNADLGTIKGIGGALDSKGTFAGVLERIETSGETFTPDFRITALKGTALPLRTTYKAVVDGTNGDVILDRVEAKLADSTFVTSGAVVGQKGVRGRFIRLDIHGKPAHLADVLRLAMKGNKPAMVGVLTIDARMDLPPGEPDVIERMTLDGRFHIERARFTNDAVQGKIDELARRGSGRPTDEGIDDVMSNMRGQFTLEDGVLRLPNLTFSVVGANVAMAGAYNLESEALDFRGDVRLQASASRTMTGFKSLLLRPFDPLLRKRGAGTRLAIKVSGTREKPSFGVELGRTLKGK